jgi:hypothetical protein
VADALLGVSACVQPACSAGDREIKLMNGVAFRGLVGPGARPSGRAFASAVSGWTPAWEMVAQITGSSTHRPALSSPAIRSMPLRDRPAEW